MYAHWADMELNHSEVRKAIQICEKSLGSTGKDDPFTWRLAGIAYTRLGQSLQQALSVEDASNAFAKAEKALKQAQKLSTESGDLSRSLSARYQLAKRTGSVEQASAVLAEWEQVLPSDPYLVSLRRR